MTSLMMFRRPGSVLLIGALLIAACSSTDPSPAAEPAKALAEQGPAIARAYAGMVRAHYALVIARVSVLASAVDAFATDPSAQKFEACRAAWLATRPLYAQTEVYRFYGGPIDDVDGLINAWPMDENYVDYVKAASGGEMHPALGYAITDDGIINNAAAFPAITKAVIRDANEMGETNLSAGFHTIEFLLWGQDFDVAGPGKRPYTDYVSGAGGTAQNQDRRRTYLKEVTELLAEEISLLGDAWKDAPSTYAAAFTSLAPAEALSKILRGMGSLGGVEITNERMNNAYATKDQEEEHDCFSDTTLETLTNDGIGIQNVYLATLEGAPRGASLSDLVRSVRPDLDAKMKTDLAGAIAATRAIPAPFDQAILGADEADGRKKIKAAMDAWKAATATIVDIAAAFKLPLNIE